PPTRLPFTLVDGVNGNRVGGAGTPLDPRLGPLQNNGGATLTYLLLPSSPARDAGDPGFDGAGLTDQRGAARVVNGRVDIGALEAATGLLVYYPFDNFNPADALGSSSLTYQGDGGVWWNTDHRGQGSCLRRVLIRRRNCINPQPVKLRSPNIPAI
ncbi:MAG TPA: choice-of-anchor Q domain-containing protein, partial [Cellvibrionaceae bacterium]|nr:choice-of-anchor Q domain-containing protein [Cellvibrionaceae bacterium]